MFEANSTYLLTQTVRAVMTTLLPRGRSIDDVVADLRLLRFNDEGILSLLDVIVDGGFQKDDIKNLLGKLRDFNDKEWKVADAASRLIEHCGRVSNLTQRELELIGWRKPKIREELQYAINQYRQPRARIDKERVRMIRDGIIELNRAIDEAEDKLLHGRGR
jgi:hypothetical protein